ncbi:MAG: biotin--[acetyl-CoA-carboxylase] ligase [Desulfohalobiaceae bacterium]|nr:biotin--[acetyl-CoA-carboxylase] ligase [Desulfohalobiaceae bacterium]
MILDLLKSREVVSGQELAEAVRISRTAVWKQVRGLRSEGYRIDSTPGLGYALKEIPDLLLPAEIQAGLKTRILGREIIHLTEVLSTQAKAKELAEKDAPEGTLVLTEKQTQGRGRRQREWVSLPGSIQMSVILRPRTPPEQGTHFPLLAGVALVQAVLKVCPDLDPLLKWPNDLIVNRKKLAGILAEISSEPERINYLTLGLGLNCNFTTQDLDPPLQEIATSLQIESGRKISRTTLLQALLLELEFLYFDYLGHGFEPLRLKWKARNNTLNSRVQVTSSHKTLEGLALDIDESGGLIVQLDDGQRVTVTAGDVSIRNDTAQLQTS